MTGSFRADLLRTLPNPAASASTSSSRLTRRPSISRTPTPPGESATPPRRYPAARGGSSSTEPCWSSAPARRACALPTSFRPWSSSSSCAAGRAKQSATAATVARVAPEVGRQRARRRPDAEGLEAGSDRLVDPGHDSSTRPPKIGSVDRHTTAVGHLLVVEHGASAARAAHHVDTVARAGFEIDVVDRLHAPEAQTRGREAVQAHRTRNLAPRARVEQRQVATHVLLARRGRVDDQLEPVAVHRRAITGPARASDIESHVDDVAVAHHVVASLEPLLAALAQHRVRARVEQLLGVGHLGADESARDVGVDARRGVERGLALRAGSRRAPRCRPR